MDKKKLLSVLIALSLIVITIPITVQAPIDEWVISEVDEDVFWAAYRFDGVDMVYLQGDDMRIIGWYLFEGPDVIRWGPPIAEAYLSIMTMGGYADDPDASMVLYGVPAKLGGALSIYGEDDSVNIEQVSGPYTTSHVIVNLSSFVGNHVWHNITVTNIVREIQQGYYHYDGHDIAFVTKSGDWHDQERTIASEESGFAAKLYIHYKTPDTPPGLPPYVEFVEEYRNHTIWLIPGGEGYSLDPMEYTYTDVPHPGPYHVDFDNVNGDGPYLVAGVSNSYTSTGPAGGRNTVRDINGTIWTTYLTYIDITVSIYVANSSDEGVTWGNHTLLQTWSKAAFSGAIGSLAIDSRNNLHLVWSGLGGDLWYSKFDGSWSTPIIVSTGQTASTCEEEVMAIDSKDNLHVSYKYGANNLYYISYTGSWSMPLRISTGEGMTASRYSSITVDSKDYVHLAFCSKATGFSDTQIWHTFYTDSWSTPLRISTLSGMANLDQQKPCIALDFDDNLHVVWTGKLSVTYPNYNQIWYAKGIYPYESGDWVDPLHINSNVNQHHSQPNIALDTNESIHVIWSSYTTDVLFYRSYTDSWGSVTTIQTTCREYVTFRWARYPVEGDDIYVATDENGTVIETWNGENCTTIDCLKDDIDDEIGYGDPEDPDPPGWEESPITARRFKLILFVVGMILFVGTPVWGFAARPDAATWIAIMMSMFCGVALLWSLQLM